MNERCELKIFTSGMQWGVKTVINLLVSLIVRHFDTQPLFSLPVQFLIF